jgi:hypothetical protein
VTGDGFQYCPERAYFFQIGVWGAVEPRIPLRIFRVFINRLISVNLS